LGSGMGEGILTMPYRRLFPGERSMSCTCTLSAWAASFAVPVIPGAGNALCGTCAIGPRGSYEGGLGYPPVSSGGGPSGWHRFLILAPRLLRHPPGSGGAHRGDLLLILVPKLEVPDLAHLVKGMARHLGAKLVGIVELDPAFVYSHRGRRPGTLRRAGAPSPPLRHRFRGMDSRMVNRVSLLRERGNAWRPPRWR